MTIGALGLVLLLGVATVDPATGLANIHDPYNVIPTIVEAAERHGVDPSVLVNVALCESGLNPRAVGDHGQSHGLFQLYRWGLLPEFYAMGYASPYEPAAAADYAAMKISQGYGHKWTCYRLLYG